MYIIRIPLRVWSSRVSDMSNSVRASDMSYSVSALPTRLLLQMVGGIRQAEGLRQQWKVLEVSASPFAGVRKSKPHRCAPLSWSNWPGSVIILCTTAPTLLVFGHSHGH
uniref:Uncharacterized protein n=1 Tax=Arundo donax TaxID=35708 RepID=A0A0A9AIQ1_ARUDO